MKIKNTILTAAFLIGFFATNKMQAQLYPEMVQVPGGTFTMGDDFGTGGTDEVPLHKVTLSSFCMSQTEVTVAQWIKYCEATGNKMPDAPVWGWNDDDPMVYVSWDDAMAYCAWLSKKTGQIYTLPTEAQFEYAARGGDGGKKYKYSGTEELDDVGWYADNARSHPHPVASKKPNKLDLYDMSGNVWEWCSDWYAPYTADAVTDPKGPAQGTYRVLRGGSWNHSASYCRITCRNASDPAVPFLTGGFRVVSPTCSDK